MFVVTLVVGGIYSWLLLLLLFLSLAAAVAVALSHNSPLVTNQRPLVADFLLLPSDPLLLLYCFLRVCVVLVVVLVVLPPLLLLLLLLLYQK